VSRRYGERLTTTEPLERFLAKIQEERHGYRLEPALMPLCATAAARKPVLAILMCEAWNSLPHFEF
jgi:hypothetical protein